MNSGTLAEWAIEAHWWWLILAALLGIAEIVAPGVFLIWFAAAATLVGVLTALLPLPVAAQFLLFAASSALAVWIGRRIYARFPVSSADPLLNDRAARMVGEVVTVTDPIVAGSGRVRVGDGVWPARGGDAEVGTRLRVVAMDRGILLVEPL